MKILYTLLLATASTFAATTVSSTGGSYFIEVESYDSSTLATSSPIVVDTSASGGSYVDLAAGPILSFDFDGLDFSNYSYTLEFVDVSLRTGRVDVELYTSTGESLSLNQTGWGDAFDTYNFTGGAAALTSSTFTMNVSNATHVDSFNVNLVATQIPEPSSAALLGLGGLALLSRRKR